MNFYIKNVYWKKKAVLLEDYFQKSDYGETVASLLEKRNFKRIVSPDDEQVITYSHTEGDIPIGSIFFSQKKNYPQKSLTEKTSGSGFLSIQSKSRINNTIAKLTRSWGNQYILFSILKEYGNNKIQIPEFHKDVSTIVDSKKNFQQKKIGRDMLMIEVKKSFLWKLKNESPDSNIIHKLWNSDPVPTLGYLKGVSKKSFRMKYPKTRISYDDIHGRINNGRIWFVYQVREKELVLHIYNKLQFRLAPNEYISGNQINSFQDTSKYFSKSLGFDNVNSRRIADLNLSYIVDWDTGKWENGKKFPLGTVKWNKVKRKLISIFNVLYSSVKKTSVCLGYSNPGIVPFGCYQLFSMDFVIDSKGNVCVLGCNPKPWVGPGKWWKKFDENYIHLNDKFLFWDTLLSLTVDRYTNPNDLWKNHWIQIFRYTKRKFEEPIVYVDDISPIEGIDGKSKTRRYILDALYDSGWNIFPWKKLLKDPKFLWQHLTPKMVKLLKSDTYSEKKILEEYPELEHTGIINRIFPLFFYLGNKSMLLSTLKEKYPKHWHNIIPWSFNVDKNHTNWKKSLESNIKLINRKITWIAKPSFGSQGLGIVISEDPIDIINAIEKSEEIHWICSIYINKPLLLNQRKNHIRVFVLVKKTPNNTNSKDIKAFLYKRHFAFTSPLKYNSCKEDFEFCNLTNLAVGSRYYKKIGKNPKNAYSDFSALANTAFDMDKYNKKHIYKVSNFYKNIMKPQIENIVYKTIDAASGYITCINETNKNFEGCFTYLAFDMMFDDGSDWNGIPHCWLLEVNTSPGLRAPEKEKGRIHEFLKDMFEIVTNKEVSQKNDFIQIYPSK